MNNWTFTVLTIDDYEGIIRNVMLEIKKTCLEQ
jgi:hypothetical protein